MFKITCVKTRYFEFEAPDNHQLLLLEPPKLKTLKAMEDIQRSGHAGVFDVAELLARLISKNRQGRKITAAQILEWMDIDQMQEFLSAFMSWLKKEKSTDPN